VSLQELLDCALIGLSTVLLVLGFIPMVSTIDILSDVFVMSELFFAIAFTVQMLINLAGYGWKQFWRQWWMRFDVFIVLCEWTSFALERVWLSKLDGDTSHYWYIDSGRYARMLRFLRVLKFIHVKAKMLDKENRVKTLNLSSHDEALSTITPHEFVNFRLKHSLAAIKVEARYFYRHYWLFSVLICLMSGVTTVLGLLDFGAWVIVSISLSSLFARMLALKQSEAQLSNSNETILKLQNVHDWWYSLSSSDHLKARNVERLVFLTEDIIGSFVATSLSALKSANDDDEDTEKDDVGDKKMKKSPSAKATVRSPIKEAKDSNNNNNENDNGNNKLFKEVTHRLAGECEYANTEYESTFTMCVSLMYNMSPVHSYA
jgi:hypothetical protein